MVIDSSCIMADHNSFYSVKKAEEGIDFSISGFKGHSEPNKISNFKEICEMFPGVSFVVVGDGGGFLDGYEGICKTGSFSYLVTPSIMLNEELLERFHASEEDNKNITAIIRTLTKDYSYWGYPLQEWGIKLVPMDTSIQLLIFTIIRRENLFFRRCVQMMVLFLKKI